MNETDHARAEAYACTYTQPRDFSTDSAAKAVWTGVKAGYLQALEENRAAWESEKFVPGLFECAKCNFVLVSQTLYMKSGTVGANNSPVECSNGCGPMWRVSWKQHAQALAKRLEDVVAAVKAAK